MVSSLELKAYLTEHGTMTEEELARHFDTTSAMIAMMAERLEAKSTLWSVNRPAARVVAVAAHRKKRSAPGRLSSSNVFGRGPHIVKHSTK